MAGVTSDVTQPTSILSIVGGITFLAIIYALVSNASGTASIIGALGNGYSGALKAAKGG
jgi:hypothetical protein